MTERSNKPEEFNEKSAPEINLPPESSSLSYPGLAESKMSDVAEDEAALRVALTQTRQELHYQENLVQGTNHGTTSALQRAVGRLSNQDRPAANLVTRDALEAVMTRVQQLHRVQAFLVGRASPDFVDLSEHLQCICQGIAGSFASERVTITADLEVLDVAFKRAVAVSLGLILVEALISSFKHAFPYARRGRIRVKMRVQGTSLMRLEIEDDGCRTPVDRRNAIGLRLIEKLAQRVGGKATFTSRPGGAVVQVIFPKPDYDDDL